MHSDELTRRRLGLAMLIAGTALLSSCGTTKDWINDRISAEPDDDTPVILGAPDVDVYVTELGQIASGDPAAQAEIYADAAAAAQLTPGPSARLRLGLVLAVPGHPESNPEKAAGLLRDVLTQTQLLTPSEIALAQILLNSAERQIVVNNETRRLRTTTSRTQQTREQAVAQRLAAVEAENRQLRRELQEAEDKLEEITNIERSIRERE